MCNMVRRAGSNEFTLYADQMLFKRWSDQLPCLFFVIRFRSLIGYVFRLEFV